MKHKKLILTLIGFIISIAFLIQPYVKEKKAYGKRQNKYVPR